MPTNQENQNRVVSLFQFIEKLNRLKQKNIVNVKDHRWFFSLSTLHDDPENITVRYRDRVENEDENTDEVLLSVRKPLFQKCPAPDSLFADWLEKGWEDYRQNASVKETLENDRNNHSPASDETYGEDNQINAEKFSDNEARVRAYESWLEIRNHWKEKQQTIEDTRHLFSELYALYFELQRETETEEIIVANGLLLDKQNRSIRHPVLTHRVTLKYDADANTVSIEDTGTQSEFYSIVFQDMRDINMETIKDINYDLLAHDYHPLDRNDTPIFLKKLIHQISSDSYYSEKVVQEELVNERLLLCWDPCFIVRKRLDGSLKAIEQIIENIQATGEVPSPIVEIVSGGTMELPADTGTRSIEEQLAAVGGESEEILLSKEANREQLEIARRIEKYNAVLVQGPPGTGKTHTIANLMGHFIAQGKSVLVTSYTTKALSVLKEKVAPGLQSLCVSLLDDSNVDMEKSVDGITDYMSRYNSDDLKNEMEKLAVERKTVMKQLAEARRKIFEVIQQEYASIVLNGEEITPSKAAGFLCERAEDLSYIPGPVRDYAPLPLSFDELTDLYRSNGYLAKDDETELSYNIPNPDQIMSPEQHKETWIALHDAQDSIKAIEREKAWNIWYDETSIHIDGGFGFFQAPLSNENDLQSLKEYVASIDQVDGWMKCAAVDGKNGGAYRQRWEMLMDQVRATKEYSESIITERFGRIIEFKTEEYTALKKPYELIKGILEARGKISKISMAVHKEIEPALAAVSIDGHSVENPDDCDIILHSIELQRLRKKCAQYWNELLASNDIPGFYELDKNNPENIAANWLPHISRYLDWYQTDYQTLVYLLQSNDLPADVLFNKSILDSDIAATGKILDAVKNILPYVCDAELAAIAVSKMKKRIREARAVLSRGGRERSRACLAMMRAIEGDNYERYALAFGELRSLYEKYDTQKKRKDLLDKLEPYAPVWADAVRSRRGVHGSETVPANIEDAWKWIQLSQIISKLTAKPFAELQAESVRLSKEYRSVTARYAEKSGWYHLLRRTEADIDMKQALQGWKLTVKRIGKGTGKSAPALKAEARRLMTKCQNAVPGWIMPINRALESLNPTSNRFDIIIIDEASQADISSLAILYMGRKLIIVGDDKQVSPMAVGAEEEKMSALEQQYLRGSIPNAHLYRAKTSIYDIAATTFQPLMLREHFRCVPEIIGFSNSLSYDGKIKPLRDASDSVLLPAVVNYRVRNGQRNGKTNFNEAKTIVALMQACMEQPEYAGKSFGVISLLAEDQARLIQQMIEKNLDSKEIIRRKILCGISANFQGDERDVVFLSLVDSSREDGPNHMVSFGQDDAIRKRYNVAASRARDQLWVVDSLDPANDLKPGDLRKRLIEYSINPQSSQQRELEVEQQSESPFEASVAKALIDLGYHIEQQRQVGAYRLDMVAICGDKTVAIECDGERWHSGEAKIREDMERQTILERLGWRFIRIRGSEYYRDPKATIERVAESLKQHGIEPESTAEVIGTSRDTDLLKRVKQRAFELLEQNDDEDWREDEKTIEFALGATKYSGFREARGIAPPQQTNSGANTPYMQDNKPNKSDPEEPRRPEPRSTRNKESTTRDRTSNQPNVSSSVRENERTSSSRSFNPTGASLFSGNRQGTGDSTQQDSVTIKWDVEGKITTTFPRKGLLPRFDNPKKRPDDERHYTFKRWDKKVVLATEDATYKAIFAEEPHKWGEEIVIRAPDYGIQGIKECICEVCKYKRRFYIPPLANEWTFTGFSWTGTPESGEVTAFSHYKNHNESRVTQSQPVQAVIVSIRALNDSTVEKTYKVTIDAQSSPDGKAHSEQKSFRYTPKNVSNDVNVQKKDVSVPPPPPPKKITEAAFAEYLKSKGMDPVLIKFFSKKLVLASLYAQENISRDLALFTDDPNLAKRTINELKSNVDFMKENDAKFKAYSKALEIFQDWLTHLHS